MKRLIVTLCLALVSFSVGCSDDFQKGVEAYDKGDYETALKEWRPLAEQGNAKAQYNLGLMYDMGKEFSKTIKKQLDGINFLLNRAIHLRNITLVYCILMDKVYLKIIRKQ